MTIDEATAKVRTGGPIDEAEDLQLPTWAGAIPLREVAGEPVADERNVEGVELPAYVAEYRRSRS